MENHTFTPEEIERIQLNLMALLFYVKTHDKRNLPHCFRICERIIRNIDICRSECYSDIDELSRLIKEDWHASMEVHAGLPAYYIPNEAREVMISMNRAVSRQIADIAEFIDV